MKKILVLLLLIFSITSYSQPTLCNKIYNSWLSFRYNNFYIKPVTFSGKVINIPLEKGQVLSNDYVSQTQGFWHVVKPDCVEFIDSSVLLYTKPFNQISYNGWQDSVFAECKTSWLQFQQKGYSYSYGTWSCDVEFSKYSLPAVWMLKERYPSTITSDTVLAFDYLYNQIVIKNNNPKDYINWFVFSGNGLNNPIGEVVYVTDTSIFLDKIIPDSLYNYHITLSRDNITPETDLIEIINGKLTQSVHWGLQLGIYKKHHLSNQVSIPIKNKYNVAVTITPKGYKFYINGILTTVIWQKVEDLPNYIILTNAPDSLGLDGINVVKMSNLKYYKP